VLEKEALIPIDHFEPGQFMPVSELGCAWEALHGQMGFLRSKSNLTYVSE
jgi:hypothetical protein